MDIYADSTWPSVAMGVDVFRKALINLKNRGVKYRYITTITKDNISYCKESMKISELRHLDDIKGTSQLVKKSIWLLPQCKKHHLYNK